jgi:S-adenosylmethionine hydrolase
MKGVILTINPHSQIVDITHEIPPQDIRTAAFALLAAYNSFGPGTINVIVVDPGVGSSRRPILVEASSRFFVGPDNGVFSYIYEREPEHRVFELQAEKYFRHPVSKTFQGRDLFAPVAAYLSLGTSPDKFGEPAVDCVRLPALHPTPLKSGRIDARIIHVDRFGNCITNLTRDDLTVEMIRAGATLKINGIAIKVFKEYFAEESSSKEKVFAIWGSTGFLEIAARNRSAAKILKCKLHQTLVVHLPKFAAH